MHNDQCVPLERDEVPLRHADFAETGYRLRTADLLRAFPLIDDDDGHLSSTATCGSAISPSTPS